MILNFSFYSLCLFTSVVTIVYSIHIPAISSYEEINKFYANNDSTCDVVLKDFSASSSNFIACTIKNSHPIHACQYCSEPYTKVIAAHKNMLTAEVNGTKCKDILINHDRLEIVETIYSNIKSLWDRGFCNKCFDWINGEPILSNKTVTFFSYFKSAYGCIQDSAQTTNSTDKICQDCMKKYITLNSFYESLKTTSETIGICMDIVDTMNATRSIWSGKLNCCKFRKTPELIFLTCTGLITALPVIFYLMAKIYCDNATKSNIYGQNGLQDSRCLPSTSLTDN